MDWEDMEKIASIGTQIIAMLAGVTDVLMNIAGSLRDISDTHENIETELGSLTKKVEIVAQVIEAQG